MVRCPDVFETASKLVQGFGRGRGALASNTVYCATMHTRDPAALVVAILNKRINNFSSWILEAVSIDC